MLLESCRFNANDSDNAIIRTDQEMFEVERCHQNTDEEIEGNESESEDVQLVQDGINGIQISWWQKILHNHK